MCLQSHCRPIDSNPFARFFFKSVSKICNSNSFFPLLNDKHSFPDNVESKHNEWILARIVKFEKIKFLRLKNNNFHF